MAAAGPIYGEEEVLLDLVLDQVCGRTLGCSLVRILSHISGENRVHLAAHFGVALGAGDYRRDYKDLRWRVLGTRTLVRLVSNSSSTLHWKIRSLEER